MRKEIFNSAGVLIYLYKKKKSFGDNWLTNNSDIDRKIDVPLTISSYSLPPTYLVDFSAHYCPFWYTTHYFFYCYLCIWSATRVHKF